VRRSEVGQAAERHGIPLLQPDSLRDPAFIAALRDLEPDVIAVVAFRILPEEVFSLARLGAFNLHASLLPAFRGAAPIQRALMAGATETGVTTFLLKPAVDTGDVLLRRAVPVGHDDTGGDLHDRLAALGAQAVVETTRLLLSGLARATPQDDSLANPAPKLFREDAAVDWARPARRVHDHVRALSPHPAAWTRTPAGEVLKVYRSRVEAEAGTAGAPGEIVEAGPRLVVATADGAVELLDVQREGRARLDAGAFLRGRDLRVGDSLG
jgi:methionyl-tRNA formyltransferase